MSKSFSPMFAGDFTKVKKPVWPMLGSTKLDGIRALDINAVVVSRKLIEIPNRHVQKCFGRTAYNGLDGELIVGPGNEVDTYNQTESGVMSMDGRPQVTFNVFDDFSVDKPFHQRFFRARTRVQRAGNPNLIIVEHEEIANEDELHRYMKAQLAEGYEGIMLRSLQGPYKNGRSTPREGYLLKLKEFEDGEGVVIGAEELEHNTNAATRNNIGGTKRSSHKAGRVKGGTLGALVVKPLKGGLPFNLGTGFTAKQRAELWVLHKKGKLKGLIAKYRFQRHGMKDKPRIPSFKGFRSPIDL